VTADRSTRARHSTRARRPTRVHRRTRSVSIMITAAVALTAGVAYAIWGVIGAGSGTALTSTTVPLTLTAGSPMGTLYPGGTSDVLVTISNPNPSSIVVRSLTLDTTQGTGGFSADAGHSGCAVSALTFSSSTNGGVGWTVPAQSSGTAGTLAVTLTGALAMNLNAADACQGVIPLVYLTAGSS
jgi:hypothetical protein